MVWTGKTGRVSPRLDEGLGEGRCVGQDGDGSDEVNAAMLSLLPWGVSVLMHLGLVLLAVFVVWSTTTRLVEERVVVPKVVLSATPGAEKKLVIDKDVRHKKPTKRTVAREKQRSGAGIGKVDLETPLVGEVGGGAVVASPFDVVRRDASASLFGIGGNAKEVVYLIDGSGSLVDSLPFVLEELKRSIDGLDGKQRFTVIFSQGDGAVEVPPVGMKRVDADMKRRVVDWIDLSRGNITAMGRSDPVAALRLALGYDPELLFLLSDNITGRGRYELHQQRLMSEIGRFNKSHAKINTIQFLYPDPLEKVGLKPTLRMVSDSTGGVYKFVDGRELGIR